MKKGKKMMNRFYKISTWYLILLLAHNKAEVTKKVALFLTRYLRNYFRNPGDYFLQSKVTNCTFMFI